MLLFSFFTILSFVSHLQSQNLFNLTQSGQAQSDTGLVDYLRYVLLRCTAAKHLLLHQ